MNGTYEFLITVGCLLLLGLAIDMLGKRTSLPRVSLLIIFGILIGPSTLNLIPNFFLDLFDLIAQMALIMVGFLMGSKLNKEHFNQNSRAIISISLCGALVTGIVVAVILLLFRVPIELAILLGCISTATDPAATMDVVLESRSKSSFSKILLSVVALDDAWGLIIFSVGLAVVTALSIDNAQISPLIFAFHELGGALLLGIVIGIPATYLTGRIKPGQPMRTEALGLVFLCGGLALWLEVSYLIATMVMGSIVSNFARHHDYTFNEIENMEWPIISIFFILAGASLELNSVLLTGLIGGIYIVSRFAGKIAGGAIGAKIGHCSSDVTKWVGLAMLPHAGAALGMALVAASYFPNYGDTILSVVISATILFEIIGPLFAKLALVKADIQKTR
jgi:Kef-type K+ transport system membrane component KefB